MLQHHFKKSNYPKLWWALYELNMTVEELARRTGIPYGTLNSRVQGKHPFTLPEVYRICEVLGLAPSKATELFTEQEVKKLFPALGRERKKQQCKQTAKLKS